MREKEFLPLVESVLGIPVLADFQRKSMSWGNSPGTLVIAAPTGSGKTLAFILPLLKLLKPPVGRIQAVVIAPTRELVLQITGVIRKIASGYKVTELYGGHKFLDEENSLKTVPDIVVATPGRLTDHIERRTIDIRTAGILVADEFDKILDLGFEKQFKTIFGKLHRLSRLILTSATPVDIPSWLQIGEVTSILENTGSEVRTRQRIHKVESPHKDKLYTLAALLRQIMPEGDEKTIVFVNHRESAERLFENLVRLGADPVLYHGALDQTGREDAIAMFNNGSRPLLIATDLAARGLDIENVRSIVHYHQPLTAESYLHRNGRTARIDRDGEIFLVVGPEEDLKPWVEYDDILYVDERDSPLKHSVIDTIAISSGKKEKLSRSDVVGFLIKQCGLESGEIGKIDVRDHNILVAVPSAKIGNILHLMNSLKIKGARRKCIRLA